MAAIPLIWLASSPGSGPTLGKAISALVFYVFFLGFGEELLFRGYIQSRLNVAFGRPFTFLGVQWGWGAVIAALLFGLMHVLNLGSLATGHWSLAPWWGVWTFFAGLALSFVREKTGSILAPTLGIATTSTRGGMIAAGGATDPLPFLLIQTACGIASSLLSIYRPDRFCARHTVGFWKMVLFALLRAGFSTPNLSGLSYSGVLRRACSNLTIQGERCTI